MGNNETTYRKLFHCALQGVAAPVAPWSPKLNQKEFWSAAPQQSSHCCRRAAHAPQAGAEAVRTAGEPEYSLNQIIALKFMFSIIIHSARTSCPVMGFIPVVCFYASLMRNETHVT